MCFMARLRVYRETTTDSTAVSNYFIDEYMPGANDAQLKVYLYLLRMLSAGLTTSVSDMADLFNHTEKDVIRALKYWEKKELLELDYDTLGNLTGIHLLDFTTKSEASDSENTRNLSLSRMETPIPPAVQIAPAPATQVTPTAQVTPATQVAPAAQAATVAQGIPVQNEAAYKKPNYSASQLQAAKDSLLTREFLFVIESYVQKPLSPAEMRSVLFFKDVLHFNDDLVYYLFEYCLGRGKKDFKYIEKVAISWAEEGISTPEEAQKRAGKYDPKVYTIMNELGKSGTPTPIEVEYISRWTDEYGFSIEIIIEACKKTVLATDKNRFDYAEGILSNWKRQNIRDREDIAKADSTHQKRVASARTGTLGSSNKFNQFAQTEYNFDELEKKLIRNY